MKRIILVLCSLLMLGLVSCGNSAKAEDSNAATNGGSNAKVEDKKEDKKETPPVTLEELPFNVTILEPDSIGTVYMEATFTNNSKYAIKGFNIAALLKDKNEKTYLGTYDTVMPGETSPKFESFGPETKNPEDIEYLTYDVVVIDDAGKEIYLNYDAKLKKYTWY